MALIHWWISQGEVAFLFISQAFLLLIKEQGGPAERLGKYPILGYRTKARLDACALVPNLLPQHYTPPFYFVGDSQRSIMDNLSLKATTGSNSDSQVTQRRDCFDWTLLVRESHPETPSCHPQPTTIQTVRCPCFHPTMIVVPASSGHQHSSWWYLILEQRWQWQLRSTRSWLPLADWRFRSSLAVRFLSN